MKAGCLNIAQLLPSFPLFRNHKRWLTANGWPILGNSVAGLNQT
jgi:hypothetical protein